jgi:hypothetical protein
MGDFLTLPANSQATFYADPGSDATLYWVHDEPLLRHLGAEATEPRFRATKFRRADTVTRLNEIASRPGANEKSRVSVLLANAEQEQTLTITHVLWAMFGLLPPDQEQRPHRHQSVARSDSRRQARLLHTAGHPTGRARRHHQPDPHRLGGRRRVRHGARPVARALQRVGRPGAPNPDPGRGPANLPTQPGHPVLRPPVMWANRILRPEWSRREPVRRGRRSHHAEPDQQTELLKVGTSAPRVNSTQRPPREPHGSRASATSCCRLHASSRH